MKTMQRLAQLIGVSADEKKWWQGIAIILLLPIFTAVYICSNMGLWCSTWRGQIKIMFERLVSGFQHFSWRLKFRIRHPDAWRRIRLRAMDFADDMLDEHEYAQAIGRAKFKRIALDRALAVKPPLSETQRAAEMPDPLSDLVELFVDFGNGSNGEFFVRRAEVQASLEIICCDRARTGHQLEWAEIRPIELVQTEFGLLYRRGDTGETIFGSP